VSFVTKHSAGLLPFVIERRGVRPALRVMLVHPGGPYWARKDSGAWSICKGEVDEREPDLAAAARREFQEEVGQAPPEGEWLPLGEVTQGGGKRVTAWAVEGHVDVASLTSNAFAIEWPPRSGKLQEFPEIDRAEWFSVDEAREKILKGQLAFLDTLVDVVGGGHDPSNGAAREAHGT
jgi:predicted NUDIX family NTP pyrophosphohydrolase